MIRKIVMLAVIPFNSNQASDKFFSVPHAVPSLNNELLSRVVFARMKVRDDEDDENYVSGVINEDNHLLLMVILGIIN